jgi:UPF0716 protein FxsA
VLAALLLLPVLELVVAIEVGRAVGAWVVLAALVLFAVAGFLLVRRQGATAWRSLNRSLQAGDPPSRELADAIVLVLAGVLLIVPGFVTDVLALLLLFPLTRPLARRPLERAFLRAAADRVTLFGATSAGFGRGPGTFTVGDGPGAVPPGAAPGRPGFGPGFGGDVVEGEIVEDDPRPEGPR